LSWEDIKNLLENIDDFVEKGDDLGDLGTYGGLSGLVLELLGLKTAKPSGLGLAIMTGSASFNWTLDSLKTLQYQLAMHSKGNSIDVAIDLTLTVNKLGAFEVSIGSEIVIKQPIIKGYLDMTPEFILAWALVCRRDAPLAKFNVWYLIDYLGNN